MSLPEEARRQLRQAFYKSGLTQKTLAARLGVSDSQVSQVLSGKGDICMGTAQRLAKAMCLKFHIALAPDEGWLP